MKKNDIEIQKYGKDLKNNEALLLNGRMGKRTGVRCMSEIGEENFGKLVKLVNDFDGFNSIRELSAIIYLDSILLKKYFNYDIEKFDFHSGEGGDNKEIEWDIVALELDDLLTTKAPVHTTEKGKLFSEELLNINFSEFKNKMHNLDRRLWPAAALYLYTNEYYKSKQKEKREEISRYVLHKYDFSTTDVFNVEKFLQIKK